MILVCVKKINASAMIIDARKFYICAWILIIAAAEQQINAPARNIGAKRMNYCAAESKFGAPLMMA
jgi:hypothetical protein